MTTPDGSAKADIDLFLSEYGLSGLGAWAYDQLLNGVSYEQILLNMRDTPQYQTRFPAMAELAKKGRAVSEAEYIGMERSYSQVMQSYGLPSGFYDSPDDFGRFIGNDVSPSELNDRVKSYTSAVLGDTETLTQLNALYGSAGHTGNAQGDLLAMYLDPAKALPLLDQRFAAAQFSAVGVRSGFGGLTAAEAEQFGARVGTAPEQAAQGFGALVQSRELMSTLPGEQGAQISRDTQLGAVFGDDALAQQQIEQRRRTRVAAGQSGGGFSSSQKGIGGLGSSEV